MRHHVLKVLLETVHELDGRGIALHEFGDGAIASRAPAQRRDEMRVRQAPYVEHQIGVDRHAVFVAEAEERDHQARLRSIARQPHEELPQLVYGHVGRVDDLVGHVADGVEARALFADSLAGGAARRERMRPPRLAEAAHERRVARLEEDENRVQLRQLAQAAEDFRKRRQESPFAHVDHDRDLFDIAARVQRQLGQRGNERRRKVVDAEVAEVFERANRLRFAGAGQAREDDERRSGLFSVLARRVRSRPLRRMLGGASRRFSLARHPNAAAAALGTARARSRRRRSPHRSSSSSSSGAGIVSPRSVRSSRSASRRAA